jgi:acetyl-CoA C-acetyltransferase
MYRDGYFCPLAEMVMGETAELLADACAISRRAQDEFALDSHRQAVAAWESGAFAAEVVPVEARDAKGRVARVERDERPRGDTTLEGLARLRPAFRPDGTVTPGNASGITDGAAALVLAGADWAAERGLRPLARLAGWASAGVDPRSMGLGPVPATRKLLERTGLALENLDLIELNEAFAAQVLAVEKELQWDTARRNVHGGAVALGHPTGCSGARIAVTLLHALHRYDKERGLATLCVSGGLGMSLLFERV